MGLRGPKRVPTDVLKARGSRLAKRRSEKLTSAPMMVRPKRARPIKNLPQIIRDGIPGYNPYDQAGDCVFDEKAAKRAIRFFEVELSHVKGAKARQPFLLEKWQQAVIGNLFGWKRKDGTRRYRQSLIFVPRKNGKSPLAAGIILYCLLEDNESGAEVYGCASTYGQASLVFEHARGMVLQNERLAELVKVYTGQARAIQTKEGFSTYRVVAAESKSAHGFNTHAYIIDELHALPDSELMDVLETSTGARRQPLGVYITTSDYERPGSPCNAKYDYASKVRDGIIDDPSFLPVIFEASIDDDWKSEKVWEKANPNIDVSVSREYLRSACAKAEESPRFLNTFLRLHLNIRTESDVRWLPMDRWDECAGEPVCIEDYSGRECWGGLDLASTRDLTALVLAFPEPDGVITLLPVFWIPRETAHEREKKDRIPYTQWIRDGLIRGTEGAVCDYAEVRRDINELIDKYKITIRELALDRLFQGAQLGTELAEQDGINVVAHGQGFLSMAAPTKGFEELVIGGKIHHGGNAVLRWHASNVSVELDSAGNLKPSRKKSVQKIDGVVASIMATGRCAAREQRVNPYADRGLSFV